MHFPGLEKSWILGIMHQSMLSPRVGGPGIPRGFDKISFPVGKDVRRVRFIWFLPFSIFYRAVTKYISESTCGKST